MDIVVYVAVLVEHRPGEDDVIVGLGGAFADAFTQADEMVRIMNERMGYVSYDMQQEFLELGRDIPDEEGVSAPVPVVTDRYFDWRPITDWNYLNQGAVGSVLMV